MKSLIFASGIFAYALITCDGAENPGPPTPTNTIYDCYPEGAPADCAALWSCNVKGFGSDGQQGYTGYVVAPGMADAEKCVRNGRKELTVTCAFQGYDGPCDGTDSENFTANFEIYCENLSTGDTQKCSSGTYSWTGIIGDSCIQESEQEVVGKQTCSYWSDSNWLCKFNVWSCQ